MATITFDEVSTELASQRQEVPALLPPSVDGGRVRVKRFSYTAAGAVTTGSQIELVELPAGAVVLQTAVSSASYSNSAEVQIGYTSKVNPNDDNDEALFAANAGTGVSGAATSNVEVGTDGTQVVFATTSVGDLAADDSLAGRILYVLNT